MSLRASPAFPVHLFRRDVVGRAHGLREFREREAPHSRLPRDSEVDELDAIISIDHDVVRLEVAVNDAMTVNVAERIADAQHNAARPLRRQPAFPSSRISRRGRPSTHSMITYTPGLWVGQHFHNAGMIEPPANVRFAMKAVENRTSASICGSGILWRPGGRARSVPRKTEAMPPLVTRLSIR